MRPQRILRVTSFVVSLASVAAPMASTTIAHAQQLSEADRKASARSAYTEGVKLMEENKHAEALQRFEAAQKLYDAPTHLLRIAECQAATGKLVEAAETYEVLIRKNLGANPPEAFTDAQQKAGPELKELRTRIPTLRVTVKPDPQTLKNLQVTINGAAMPNELLTIARPLNPGMYRLNAAASGYKLTAPVDVVIAEREAKTQELSLVPGQAAPIVVAPAPAPYQPYPQQQPPPPPPPYQAQPGQAGQRPGEGPAPAAPKPESSSWGLLLGGSLGVVIPGGGLASQTTQVGGFTRTTSVNFDEVATAGGGGGLDVRLRFAKMAMFGLVFDYAGLGEPESANLNTGDTLTASTTYFGANLGLVTNIDKASFFGEIGVGRRALALKYQSAALSGEGTLSGIEGGVGAGLNIPVGPVRLVPKATIFAGPFTNRSCDTPNPLCQQSGKIENTAVHTFFFVGLNAFYHLDLGKKSGT